MFGKVNDAYESVKNGLEIKVELATAEQKEKLADAKLALAELKDLLADLKDENRTLKERLQVKEELKAEIGHQWLYKVEDEDPSRRYCQVCYYDKGKVMPLNPPETGQFWTGHRLCPACNVYRGR